MRELTSLPQLCLALHIATCTVTFYVANSKKVHCSNPGIAASCGVFSWFFSYVNVTFMQHKWHKLLFPIQYMPAMLVLATLLIQ